MNPETFLQIQRVIVILTAPAAIGFPIWYHLRLRWRSSEMGRHVMGYSSVVAFLYSQALIGIWWPTYPGQVYVALLVALLMMIVIWWRVIVFVHIRRQMRQRSDEEENEKI